jgi:hypothetical protein
VWGTTAFSQQTPLPVDPAQPSPEPESLEDAPAETLPGVFAGKWRWVNVGPREVGRMYDVAISNEDPDVVATISETGAVWISEDGMVTWTQVLAESRDGLGTGSADEDLLIGVEARVDEIRGDLSFDDLEVDPDDYVDDPDGLAAAMDEMAAAAEELADSAAAATAEALDQVRGEVADGVFFESDSASWKSFKNERESRLYNRVWFDRSGRLLAGRGDGIHVSLNRGVSWTQVLETRVTALIEIPQRGFWIAGTSDGVRYSDDLVNWTDRFDGTEAVQIWDLKSDGTWVYAATSSGLWLSTEGQSWQQVGMYTGDYRALLPVEEGNGLLLSSGRSVRLSRDGGFTLLPDQGTPLSGAHDLMGIAPGHVLVATSEGPWESVDGGETWVPLNDGLSESLSYAYGLARSGLSVLMASGDGVYQLTPLSGARRPRTELGQDVGLEEWIDLHALMGTAMSRRELVVSVGSRALAATLPEVTIQGSYLPRDTLKYAPLAGSAREFSSVWAMGLILKWTGSRPSRPDLNPVTIGTDVEVTSSLSPATLGGAVRRSANSYAAATAVKVIDLYGVRSELVAIRAATRQAPLREQVERELKILELEAQLDHITNGAVSAWRSQ